MQDIIVNIDKVPTLWILEMTKKERKKELRCAISRVVSRDCPWCPSGSESAVVHQWLVVGD